MLAAFLCPYLILVLYIVMDTSLLWNQFCLISISVVYRGRAIPIIWKVVEQSSSMMASPFNMATKNQWVTVQNCAKHQK